MNIQYIMQYDYIWDDGKVLAGTKEPDYDIMVKRWDLFQKIIFTEYKQTKRVRAQVLGLKVTKGELVKAMKEHNDFTKQINKQALRIELGDDDREIWLWPVAVRAPMAHSHVDGGVRIDDSKTSFVMNPGVGYTLGGGFHCTTFECIHRIFQEGLRPGGGGDRINTFFVPFAPWDERCKTILKFKKIDGADLVSIYMTYESLAKFSPRVSADGHILVQQTIPFSNFDAVWHRDWKTGEFYRLMVTNGCEQLVLSVNGAKRIATVERFDNLTGNVMPDDSSHDLEELRKLIDTKSAHISCHCKLFPGHPEWDDAISLLALTHRPGKEGHRLCPACLCETPAILSICVICKGHHISHGFRKRVKVTVTSVPTAEHRSQDEDVKDHVKQAWEKVKIDLTSDDEGEGVEHEEDVEDIEMESPPEEKHEQSADANPSGDNEELKSEKRDYREQDEVDKFLKEEREKAETINEEEMDIDDADTREFHAGETRNVQAEYPAWMKRIEYGSKVLPTEACVIGDAQLELIKIMLLQMGNNLLKIHKHYHRNFCEDPESAWQHFQRNDRFRLDLDPRVPYLGEDDDGNPIEPTDEQMRNLYGEICTPGSKEDLGADGFTCAYYGAIVFKKLITYVLECGYTLPDLQQIFYDESAEQLTKGDTAEEEYRKSTSAREQLDEQSYFVRRVIAGAYNVNAVYFFRNVDYQYSVTLNPMDILCACRPQIRRIAVMHLIIQNGQQLPRALMTKLTDAINEYNNSKKRKSQRPRWGTHLTESHVAAIANSPAADVPQRGPTTEVKAKAMPKPSASPSAESQRTNSSSGSGYVAPTPKQTPQPPPPKREGKGKGKDDREEYPWRESESRGKGTGKPAPWRENQSHGRSSGTPSHRGGDWNYTGRYHDNRGWRR